MLLNQEATFDVSETKYSVTLGQSITNDFAPKTMSWNYDVEGMTVVTPRSPLIIVNPYVTFGQFKTWYPGDLSFEEFRLVEPEVRRVVSAFCNDSFSRDDNVSYTIKGQDSDTLALPRRIIDADSVEILDPHQTNDGDVARDITDMIVIDDDNRWNIRRRTSFAVDRKTTPVARRWLFARPKIYKVTGSWGWANVPFDVSHATAILINDYQCADAKYREKYLSNIRAGDWRMEFAVVGDETTGNANADMMLWRYRNLNLAVI